MKNDTNTNSKVMSLGNFWEITAPAVQEAQKASRTETYMKSLNENAINLSLETKEAQEQVPMCMEMWNKREELAPIFKKIGLTMTTYFPFYITNRKNTLIPKDIEKMKKDAKTSREKIQDAFDKGKIDKDNYDMLMQGLDQMLEENGYSEEEIDEKDVDEMYENFEEEVRENIKGLVASLGGEDAFEDMCKEYDETKDLDERKWKLQEMNSKINQKLGISGKLKFSKDDNLAFENSFIKGGYMISEKDVMENGLKETTVEMMEKAMVRQMMMDKKNEKTKKEKEALFNKIAKEKEKQRQEKEMTKNKKQARKRMLTFFNS